MSILQEAWPKICFTFFGLSGLVGLLALVNPKAFAFVAEAGGIWVTTPKSPTGIDSPIDIDQFVIRNSRQFGALVLMVVCYLTLSFLGRLNPAWTPAFLLLILGVSVLLVFSGMMELRGEVSKIETELADARIDAVTGLANRRVFDDELGRRLCEKLRKGAGFCLAIFDIDHFKEFNDRYGHLIGDMVLKNGVADVIRSTTRTMDMPCRYGGDEFAIIFPASNLSEACIALEHLRTAVAGKRILLEDAEITVTLSIGVAEASEGDDVASLIKRADDALYAAKKAGRNLGYRHNGRSCEPISALNNKCDSR